MFTEASSPFLPRPLLFEFTCQRGRFVYFYLPRFIRVLSFPAWQGFGSKSFERVNMRDDSLLSFFRSLLALSQRSATQWVLTLIFQE